MMKIKINVHNCIDSLCIAYPVIYEMAAMISDSIGRRFSLLMIIFLLFGLFKSLKKKNLIALSVIFIFILMNAIRFGVFYIVHQDFYGLILLLLILLYYSDKKRLANLEKVILNEHFSNAVILLFYFALLISVLFFHGLQTNADWGVAIPMLYGPYGLPHTLAYNLISIYSICSILWHKNKRKLYLVLMAITSICLIWTGVRSTILVLAVLLICDYASIKQISKRLTILCVVGVVFAYLLLFTDIIFNNPIVQKSIIAAGKGSGITNSRTDFNAYLAEYFIRGMSYMEKLFGISIPGLRKYMRLRYGTEIHAHNDVMNILIGMGVTGFLIYAKSLLTFCLIKEDKKKSVLVFSILFLLSFFNGLYMYLGFVPCVPIVYVYVIWLNRENVNSKIVECN